MSSEEGEPRFAYDTNTPLDEPLPIEFFKLTRKIKCLPLLEPKILDDKLRKLKHKRRDVRRTAKRLAMGRRKGY